MKDLFNIGDRKSFKRTISEDDTPKFEGRVVHPVCATYVLAKDFEWSSRLFVLDIREEDEEGIGTFVNVKHLKPIPLGAQVTFTAIWNGISEEGEILCDIEAHVGERLVAVGQTGQKILSRRKLENVFSSLN